ncbi:MAG: hypothetical protein NVS2B16_30410 [Chloroflexota bacterium]
MMTLEQHGLVLVPGAASTLSAAVYDTDGSPLAAPKAMQWSSDDPSVASIDEKGRILAKKAGVVEILATDLHQGSAASVVVVAPVVPAGASGVTFSPPVMRVRVGEVQIPSFEVVDAGGRVVSPQPPTVLATSASAVASASGASIAGVSEGIATATVRLRDSTTDLPGSLVVLVTKSPPTTPDTGKCDRSKTIVGACAWANAGAVRYLSKPGAKREMRVSVMRHLGADCVAPLGPLLLQEQSPDEVKFKIAGVVDVTPDGLLTGLAPGNTDYVAYVEGVPCGRAENAIVGLDMGGSWNVSCDNGDSGAITFKAQAAYTTAAEKYGGSYDQMARTFDGKSCMHGSNNFFCQGIAEGNSQSARYGLANQLCSDGTPCNAIAASVGYSFNTVSFRHCASGRANGHEDLVFGADHVKELGCDYRRGGSGCEASAPPGAPPNSCDGRYSLSIPGTTCSGINFSGDTISITVAGGVATASSGGVPTAVDSDCTIRQTVSSACGPQTVVIGLREGGVCQWPFACTDANGRCQELKVQACAVKPQ